MPKQPLKNQFLASPIHRSGPLQVRNIGLEDLPSSVVINPVINNNYVIITDISYSVLSENTIILCTTSAITITLPSPIALKGKIFIIKNIAMDSIMVNTADGEIEGESSIEVVSFGNLTVFSDGENYWII